MSRRKYDKEYYQENKDRIQTRCRIFGKKASRTPEYKSKHLLILAKQRASKQRLDCSITAEDIYQQLLERCPVFDCSFQTGEGFVQSQSATLDRFDPKLGYTKENTWVISKKANTIKSDATADDVLRVAVWMYLVNKYGKQVSRSRLTHLLDRRTKICRDMILDSKEN